MFRSVSTLVLMAGFEDGDMQEFGDVLKGQIKALRDQLDKDKDKDLSASSSSPRVVGAVPVRPSTRSSNVSTVKVDERSIGLARIWDASSGTTGGMPGALPSGPSQQTGSGARRELRSMAYSLGRSFMS